NTLGDLGKIGYEEGLAKEAKSAIIAQHMRMDAQTSIQQMIGPSATEHLQFVQGRHALYEQMFRILQEAKDSKVFPDVGGINMRGLQDAIFDAAFGQTPLHASNRDKLGGHLYTMLETA